MKLSELIMNTDHAEVVKLYIPVVELEERVEELESRTVHLHRVCRRTPSTDTGWTCEWYLNDIPPVEENSIVDGIAVELTPEGVLRFAKDLDSSYEEAEDE